MLAELKQLPLLSKIIFVLSLILLFIWVIPNMFEYYKNVKILEQKEQYFKKVKMQYDIVGEAKKFDVKEFKEDVQRFTSNVELVPNAKDEYTVQITLDKSNIYEFNSLLESLSLRYLVKIIAPLEFSQKEKQLQIKLILKTL